MEFTIPGKAPSARALAAIDAETEESITASYNLALVMESAQMQVDEMFVAYPVPTIVLPS